MRWRRATDAPTISDVHMYLWFAEPALDGLRSATTP